MGRLTGIFFGLILIASVLNQKFVFYEMSQIIYTVLYILIGIIAILVSGQTVTHYNAATRVEKKYKKRQLGFAFLGLLTIITGIIPYLSFLQGYSNYLLYLPALLGVLFLFSKLRKYDFDPRTGTFVEHRRYVGQSLY